MHHKKVFDIPITRPFLPPRAELNAELDKIYAAARLANGGQATARLQTALQRQLAVPQVSLFGSGHLALEAALRVFVAPCPGGQVITTPFTFASTVNAILRCGLQPVFCDIKRDDFTLDAEQLEHCINERTCAILPVYVYGHPCNIGAIHTIADQYSLPVIYDAAHAFGVTVNGQNLARAGRASVYSFHATKLFHTAEGGAVAVGGPAGTAVLRRNVDALRLQAEFGLRETGDILCPGGNGKMNELEAAMGLCVLPHLREIIACRRALTWRYREQLAAIPGLRMFYPDQLPGVEYNYAYFPVQIDPVTFGCSRDALWHTLQRQGIEARRYFWPAIPDAACYRAKYGGISIPVARHAAETVLCLPLFDSMTFDQLDRVCAAVRAARKS